MKNLRRKRLTELLESPRFNGDRSAFLTSANISKGRLSQLLDPKEPFGDAAARNLCDALGLPEGWFDAATASASLTLPSPTLVASATNHGLSQTGKVQAATDIEASLHCLRMASLRVDDADRDALASYVSKMIREPDRADLVPRALNILSPPAHKAMPETGGQSAAA